MSAVVLQCPSVSRHGSSAKAVGWPPLSDGKLLLMCWIGCQVLALLVREGREGWGEGTGVYRKGAL